jgi:Uma2 family endonuclease
MRELKRKKPATYEDIEELPLGWVGEILEDELFAHPRPAAAHLQVASRLGILLGRHFEEGVGSLGGWWILDEPELHFGRDVVVPDLAGWRRERLPFHPGSSPPFITLAPDWVCEVLSPSTASVDRGRKMPVYQREGVSSAWIIDPRKCTLEVFHLGHGGWQLAACHVGNTVVRAEPYEAVPLDLGLLWSPRTGRAPGPSSPRGP